jgi:hypothetical protein
VTHRYALDIPGSQRIAFQLDLPVEHPGTLRVHAEWSGARILSFKLEGPGGDTVRLRRSGPSPQALSVEVEPESAEIWKLSILGLPASDSGEGVLTVDLPDHPEVVARQLAELAPPEEPPPAPDPWMVEVKLPQLVSNDRAWFVATVEAFRRLVVTPDLEMGPDACQWQEGFLQYLAGWRDRNLRYGELPEPATHRYLAKTAEAVRLVESLRVSADPTIAGPPPADSNALETWRRNRRGVFLPLEKDLDALLDMLQDGFVPELEDKDWPVRFVSCLMACERNIEERGRLGRDRAANGALVEAQWQAFVSAARALEALTAMGDPQAD